MSVDNDLTAYEQMRRNFDNQMSIRAFEQNAQRPTTMDFSNPRTLGLFKHGYAPEASDQRNAYSALAALTPAQQEAVGLYSNAKIKGIKPIDLAPKAFTDATADDISAIYGLPKAENREYIQGILDSGNAEQIRALERGYNVNAADLYGKQRQLAEMIENPKVVPALAKMKSEIALGDSTFRRAANALVTGVEGSVYSFGKGTEQLLSDVYYHEVKAAYAVSDTLEHIFDTKLPLPEEKEEFLQSIADFSEDVRSRNYVPTIEPGGSHTEALFGALGSMAVYVGVGSVSPIAMKSMLYTSGYETVRTAAGKQDPTTGMVMGAVLGGAYGYVNQIALDKWMRGARTAWGSFGTQTLRAGGAEFLAESASTLITTGAYHLGGALSGEYREPFNLASTIQESLYSGGIGGASSMILSAFHIPRAVKAAKQQADFKRLHGEVSDTLTEVISNNDQAGTLVARNILMEMKNSGNLPELTYIRAKDLVSKGQIAVDAFLEESGISQDSLDEAVKFDMDLRADSVDVLMANAKARVRSGQLDPMVVTPAETAEQADLIARILNGEGEANQVVNQQAKYGIQLTGEQVARVTEIVELMKNVETTPDGARRIDINTYETIRNELMALTRIPKIQQTSISDLARPDSSAVSIGEQKLKQVEVAGLLAEYNSREVINELDDVYSIRKLRSDLMRITNDSQYVSATMHVVKSSLSGLAREAGIDPLTYANTIAVETILSNKSLKKITDTTTQMQNLINKETGQPQVKDIDLDVPDTVKQAMTRFNLGGRYRTALSGYLNQLIAQGKDVTDVSGITNTVTRMVDTANAFEQQAQQMRTILEPGNEVSQELMQVFGLEGVEGRTAVENFATELEATSKNLMEFYKNPSIIQTIEATGLVRAQVGEAITEAAPVTTAEEFTDRIINDTLSDKAMSVLGNVRTLAPRAFQIKLTGGKANYSTFPHEWFHIYLNLAKADAPQVFALFEEAAGGTLFNEDGTATAVQERLAAQFENYLLEPGKKLSPNTDKIFDAYSEFLGRVYDREGLVILPKISDDLRYMFDMMFTTNEQMRAAETINGITQNLIDVLPDDNPAKNALRDLYSKVRRTSRQAARARTLGEYMKLVPEERNKYKEQARNDVNNKPINILYNELRNNKSIDFGKLKNVTTTDTTDAINDIDTFFETITAMDEFVDRTPESVLAELRNTPEPRRQITKRFKELVDARIQELSDALPDNLIDESLYGEDLGILLDKMYEAAAIEEKKEVGRREARQEYRRSPAALQRNAIAADIKNTAANMADQMGLRALRNYKRHVGAFKRSLIDYGKAMSNGDAALAADHMNNARIAYHLIDHGIKAKDLTKDMKRKYGYRSRIISRMNDMDWNYAIQAQTVLGKYGLNSKFAKDAESKTHLEFPQMADQGFSELLLDMDTALPKWIVNLENTGSFEDLTYKQVQQLSNALNIITRSGDIAKQSILMDRFKSVKQTIDESKLRMKNLPPRPETYKKVPGPSGAFNRTMDLLNVYAVPTESILTEADGFTSMAGKGYGPLETMFHSARAKFALGEHLNKIYAAELKPHFETIGRFTDNFNNFKSQLGPLPERMTQLYGVSEWTPELAIMVAMNTGNAGNLKTIVDGYSMSMEQVTDVMNAISLQEGVLDALQGIGDTLEKMYKPLDDVLYATKGVRMEKVEPMPNEWAGGSVRGWYFPIISEGSFRNGTDFIKNLYDSIERRPGFTQSRVVDSEGRPTNTRPARLDISTIANHVWAATHVIATAETMQDVNKVITDREWADLFKFRFGSQRYEDLVQHFGNMANPHTMFTGANSIGSKALNFLRNRGVDAALAFNFKSALKQKMDILPSALLMMNRNRGTKTEVMVALAKSLWSMGIKNNIGLTNLPTKNAAGEPVINGSVADVSTLDPIQFAFFKSDILSSRDNRIDQNIRVSAARGIGQEMTLSMFGKDIGTADVRDGLYFAMRLSDRQGAAMLWNAQYALSMQGKGTFDLVGKDLKTIEAMAITDADAIATEMGSNQIADMTSAQRDQMMRPFTSFMTSQVRKAGRGYSYVQAWRAGMISGSNMLTGVLAEVYGPILLTTGAGFLADLLFESDEEKRKKRPDDWGIYKDLATESFTAVLDPIPIANMAGSLLKGYKADIIATSGLTGAVFDMRKSMKAIEEGKPGAALQYGAYFGGYWGGIPIRSVDKQTRDLFKRLGYYEERKYKGETYSNWKF